MKNNRSLQVYILYRVFLLFDFRIVQSPYTILIAIRRTIRDGLEDD